MANQELRRAVQAGKPESFGIRRKVDFNQDRDIRSDFYDLLIDDDVLQRTIAPRTRLHLTIMRRRQLDSQLKRGLVIGYEFGRAATKLQYNIRDTQPFEVRGKVTQPRIMKQGRAIVLAVESEELQAEAREVMKNMASIGLKGALRSDAFRPHITLGESTRPLSRDNKVRALDLANELSVIGEEVTFMPLEFYPPPDDYAK